MTINGKELSQIMTATTGTATTETAFRSGLDDISTQVDRNQKDLDSDRTITLSGDLTGEVNDKVKSDNIVLSAELGSAVVDGDNIAALAVGNGHLAEDSVTNDKVADDAINTDQIVNSAITHPKLGDSCVDSDNIMSGVVNLNHLGTDNVGMENDVLTRTATGMEWAAAGGGAPAHTLTGSGTIVFVAGGSCVIEACGGGGGGWKAGATSGSASTGNMSNGGSSYGKFLVSNIPAGAVMSITVGTGGEGRFTNGASNASGAGNTDGTATTMTITSGGSTFAQFRVNGGGRGTLNYNGSGSAGAGGQPQILSGAANVIILGPGGARGFQTHRPTGSPVGAGTATFPASNVVTLQSTTAEPDADSANLTSLNPLAPYGQGGAIMNSNAANNGGDGIVLVWGG